MYITRTPLPIRIADGTNGVVRASVVASAFALNEHHADAPGPQSALLTERLAAWFAPSVVASALALNVHYADAPGPQAEPRT